jgi:hypothetical protein
MSFEKNPLKYRKNRFVGLFDDNNFIKFKKLIAFKKIERNQFYKIQNLCLDFILSSFDIKISKKITSASINDKLNLVLKNIKKLYSITPNGFIIPKSHSQLEYNLLLKTFYNLFNQTNLKNKIKYWQEPIGICIKYYDSSHKEEKKARFYHQTSNAHIESWAGYSNLGINTLLPVFGNTKENYTEFFEPKNNFDDYEVNNVKKNNFEAIKNLNYKKKAINSIFKNHYQCGTLICWDNIFLHKTKIKNKKSFRIFIVNQFIPHLKKSEKKIEKISKFRKQGLLLHRLVSDEDTLLKFSKKNNYIFKSTLGGKRAAYNFKLIK